MAAQLHGDTRLPGSPGGMFTEDDRSHLLDKDESSRHCWGRHRCTLIAAAVILLVASAGLAMHSMGSRAHRGKSLLLINKPKSDQRQYQYTELSNGLHVVNIQDENSHQMAMAMAVKAGSHDDPRQLPGLAHFCEHMLFLGTEKYPENSGFDQFLLKYGGSSNAFTASEVTVYFAAASSDAASEGLDRFADFFRAPLFKQEFVKKEVQAINSEHEKNVQSSGRRIFQLLESQADPSSSVGRFATGNMETLYDLPMGNGTSPVDALKIYFKERYCPEQMKLVTFGPQPLSEQMAMLTQAGFDTLPKGVEKCASSDRSFASPVPFPPSRMGKSLLVQGTEATGSIWAHFQLPSLVREHRAQPLTYLHYLINYGGERSLSRVLSDDLGLVASVGVEEQTDSTGTMCLVVFYTTPLGFNKSEAILDVFFAYLGALRAQGVDMDLYKSLQDMVKLQWNWKQEADPYGTVSDLAEVMTRLPRDKLLSGDSLIEQPDASLLLGLIEDLTPSNMNLARVSPSGLGEAPLKEVGSKIRTLQYYDAKYVEQTLDEAMPGAAGRWNSWLSAGRHVEKLEHKLQNRLAANKIMPAGSGTTLLPRLPSAIQGIPTHISQKHMQVARYPSGVRGAMLNSDELLTSEKLYGPQPVQMNLDLELPDNSVILTEVPAASVHKEDVWFRSGWTVKDPKVHIAVALRSLQEKHPAEVTAFDSTRLAIYSALLSEAMEPKLYDLTAAGSSYSLSVGSAGITISFVGYYEAFPNLIEKVMHAFNSFNENLNTTQQHRFERIVKTVKEDLETYGDMPSTYASQDLDRLLSRNSHAKSESLKALAKLNLTSAARTAGDLVLSKKLKVTALSMGNLGDIESTSALRQIVSLLKRPSWVKPVQPPAEGKLELVPPVVDVNTPVEVRAVNPRPGDPNDVATVSILYGVSDVPSRVILSIASAMLGTAAFDHLRTEQQLGYVVWGGMGMQSNILYVKALVQGSKVNADEAEAAIEGLFTEIMPSILKNMTSKDFQDQVDAYRQQLLEPPLGAFEEVGHFWSHIMQGGQCMHLLDEALTFLNSKRCSKELLAETWNNLVFGKLPAKDVHAPAYRKKLTVKYFASKGKQAPARPSVQEARKIWKKHGVAESAMALLETEWKMAKVVSAADSKVREELQKEGGYFPTDLNCGSRWRDGSPTAEAIMRLPSGAGEMLHMQASSRALRHGLAK
mmetsp:Transcript_10508/g.25436  ORF Transcript_10508/g.25436 Transcript_10508/m.25436 type:complete len:1201 (+) Transcript_10508:52-3654(+)